MHTNPNRWWLPGLVIGALLVWSGIGLTQRVSEPEIRLQEALHKEQVEGDLAGAIKLYERVAADRQAPRPVAAQALLNAGRCYEKLRRREAQHAYERIVTQFTDQGAIAAQARARLAAMLADRNGAGAGLSSTKLTTFATMNSTNVSVDGRFTIASPGLGLSIVELTTGELRRIPNDPLRPRGRLRAQAISPDGKQIAYFVVADGSARLRIVGPGDSSPREVSLVTQRAIRAGIPGDWSRDGRRIAAFLFWRDAQSDGGREALGDIAIVDVATGNLRVLESALATVGSHMTILPQRVRFSPDGEYLAFDVSRSTRAVLNAKAEATTSADSIFTVRADGSGAERLAIGTEAAELYGWLPDGKAIVFAKEVGGVRALWAVPVEGGRARGTPVVLMRGVGHGEPVGITAAGSLIYTVDGSTRRSYVVNLSERPLRRISVNDAGHCCVTSANWSPDGRHLSYIVTPSVTGIEHRLMVREVASGQEREIMNWQGGLLRGSSWSPDGQFIIVTRNLAAEGGVNRVDKVNVGTGVAALLAQIPAQLGFPHLSPDSRYLYLFVNLDLVRIDLQTKDRVRLATAAEPIFDLSSDGKLVAFGAREGTSFVLKVQSAEGGEERVVLSLRPGERINSVAWKPGTDALFLAIGNAETGTIQLFQLDTRGPAEPTPLGIFVKTFADISVHPDGRQLAFLDAEWLTEFWRIDGLSEAFAAAVRGSTPAPAARPRPAVR